MSSIWISFLIFISACNAFLTLAIAGIIFFRYKRNPLNILACLVLIIVTFWISDITLGIYFEEPMLGRINFGVSMLSMPLIHLFARTYSNLPIGKARLLLILGPALIIAILAPLPNAIFINPIIREGVIISEGPGYLQNYYQAVLYGNVIYLYYSVYLALKTLKGFKRVKLIYFSVGLLISSISGVLINMLLPVLKINVNGNLGTLPIIAFSSAVIYVAAEKPVREAKVVLSEFWAFLLFLIVLAWFWANRELFDFILMIAVLSICILFVRAVLAEVRNNRRLEIKNRLLEKAKRDLERMDKLKDEFLRTASHEFNTPLSIIRNSLSILTNQEHPNLHPDQIKKINLASEASFRLTHLVKNLIDASNIEYGGIWIERSETDMQVLIKEAVLSLQKTAKAKGLTLHWENSQQKLPTLNIDRNKVYQVIHHLIENAIKFSSEGEIKIKTGIALDGLVISVCDPGIGLTKEEQSKVFSKFFQSDRFNQDCPIEQQGSGLGLFISKNIIDLHGGTIKVKSEKNKGSCFSVILPQAE